MKKAIKSDELRRSHSDLVGIDFSTTATKVVRLKKIKGELALAGIDLQPAVDFGAVARRMELPRNMGTNYGCLTYSGKDAVVRMINAPLQGEDTMLPPAKLRELLNVGSDYRVSAQLMKQGRGRQDSSFLAAAMPEDDVRFLLGMFPAGPPAPASIEVAGLSFISAFLHARGAASTDQAVCLIEAGETVSYFAFLNKGMVALVGKFSVGAKMLRSKVAAELGVDDELAGTILADPSIDLSSTLSEVATPFLKQISISKDFIERHQGCRVAKVYVSGGVSLLPEWSPVVRQILNTEVSGWNPFENIRVDADAIPESLAGQVTRFSAAVGAAIGGFEEE
jgi:Tfp pilus assembly PilM family ATPase